MTRKKKGYLTPEQLRENPMTHEAEKVPTSWRAESPSGLPLLFAWLWNFWKEDTLKTEKNHAKSHLNRQVGKKPVPSSSRTPATKNVRQNPNSIFPAVTQTEKRTPIKTYRW
jgi:hypothetical protein